MKAIGYNSSLPIDDPNSLIDFTTTDPKPEGRDILVAVQAISVNPVDYKIRANMQPPGEDYKILGWDASGTVKAIGSEVSNFKVGDKVWYAGDLTRPGCNAQFQLVDERIVGRMPQSLSFAEAAALPLTTITAWEMLFDRLDVPMREKKSVLVIGAAGGVGSIMVQLLANLTKLQIIGTASRPKSIAWLKELGVDHIIDHHLPLSEELSRIGLNSVEYVISLNNTEDHYDEIVKCLAPQGKFGLIDDPALLDVMPLKLKSISLHWELMFTRSMFQTKDMSEQHRLLNEVSRLIDIGKIRTTLTHHLGTINAANLRAAHKMLEQREAHGKVVLEGF